MMVVILYYTIMKFSLCFMTLSLLCHLKTLRTTFKIFFPAFTYYLCWYLPNNRALVDCKEIQPVNPEGNQSWIFIGRTDAEAETPVLWQHDVKNWLLEKTDTGKDWRQEEKGMTEYEMVGWHHRLNGHEFEQALGIGEGQGSLVCCSPWGCRESDMTERLNWTELSG